MLRACLNDGVCIDGINGFKCSCIRGFGGNFCEISLEKFNKTDANKKDECLRFDCNTKAKNGICDADCNFFACAYDGGDCSAQISNPYKNCSQASYCAHTFKNKQCDEVNIIIFY